MWLLPLIARDMFYPMANRKNRTKSSSPLGRPGAGQSAGLSSQNVFINCVARQAGCTGKSAYSSASLPALHYFCNFHLRNLLVCHCRKPEERSDNGTAFFFRVGQCFWRNAISPAQCLRLFTRVFDIGQTMVALHFI